MVYDEYSDEIKNAYSKMTENRDRVGDDKFYKYFYNLLETGTNYCDFSFARLVKKVDEEWVEEIEKALPSLQYVILNPRKFIEEEREIVNIAIARNITINNGASPIPASVVIALVVLMAIIVLAVAHYCPDKFAKIVDAVCSFVSKHVGS